MEVWLSVGSNIERGDLLITRSFEELKTLGSGFVSSSIYRTSSTKGDGTWYFNCVVRFGSEYDYNIMNQKLKEAECRFGRSEESRKTGRIELDLDIVIFDSKIVREKDFIQDYFQIGYKELNHD